MNGIQNVLEQKLIPATVGIIGVLWFANVIVFSFFVPVHPMILAPVFLFYAFCIVLLVNPFPGSKKIPWLRLFDFAAIPVCAWLSWYFFAEQDRILSRIPYINEVLATDLVACALMLALLVETMRRTIGWNLLGFVLIFVVYAFFGPYFPGIFNFYGFDFTQFTEIISLTADGVYGAPLVATASFIFYFIIFGAFFAACGGGQVLIEIGMRFSNPNTGGPAKAAVVSSALMGMISGSAVANVSTTGVMTIPLMKKAGYAPEQAAAIEAVASTGGQIMPPIMGVGAFIMAELLGMNYGKIAISATIPAAAYFGSVFLLVGFLAKKNTFLFGPPKVSADELTIKVAPLGHRVYLLLPAILLVAMVLTGSSLRLSAVFATATVLVLNLVNKNRIGPAALYKAFMDGIRQSANITIPVAACGIIIGVVVQSGLANKFTALLAVVGDTSLFLALFIAMLCCMILGMAMPTVAAYLISITLFSSALVALGLPIFIVHMFCFYFGVISQITPPVCLASFTAAGIAGANSWKTGWTGFSYACVAFLVPYAFAYEPALLLQGDILNTITASSTLFIGCYALAAAIAGFYSRPLNMFERSLVTAGAIMCVIPEVITDLLGIALIIAVFMQNHLRHKKAVLS